MQFGIVCSKIARIYAQQTFAYEELHAFGAPSECGTLINRSVERDIDSVLVGAGFTRETYNRELEARTTPRFAYFSGLSVDEFLGG